MENKLFNFNNHELRVVIQNNEPWFVAKDLCEVLEIANGRDAVSRLDQDEKTVSEIPTPSRGTQQVNLVNESGLYSLIFRSNKPEAKVFKKWVTGEVLPAVRKHGVYASQETLNKMLTSPDFAIQALEALKAERAEKERLAFQNQKQSEALKLSAPKVEYCDAVLQSCSTYPTTLIAKELGMTAIELNKRLKEKRIQYKKDRVWVLYSKYDDMSYTKTNTYTHTDSLGQTKTTMTTVWTEKGRMFIHKLLATN